MVGQGFKEGLSGVFKSPLKGVQKHGAAGLFKGTVQGVLGVVIKPTVGELFFECQFIFYRLKLETCAVVFFVGLSQSLSSSSVCFLSFLVFSFQLYTLVTRIHLIARYACISSEGSINRVILMRAIVPLPVCYLRIGVGFLDLMSKTTEGLQNGAISFFDLNSGQTYTQTRPARVFGSDGRLVGYNLPIALGTKVLRHILDGKYAGKLLCFTCFL